MTLKNISLVLLLFIYTHSCFASDSLSHRSTQVVLVQLSSQHNRIEALTNDKKYNEVEEVKKDAAGVIEAMKRDFKDHFHMCPVYYYMDTNADRIRNRHFDDVLMNSDGSPAKNPGLNSTSKNYLIAYYGYPVAQAATNGPVTDSITNRYNSGEPMGKGLVINNYLFQQVAYFYKFGYQEALFAKKADKKYTYHSKHFDIDYFPLAEKFNKKLKEQKEKRK
jgi:hypothetical protein